MYIECKSSDGVSYYFFDEIKRRLVSTTQAGVKLGEWFNYEGLVESLKVGSRLEFRFIGLKGEEEFYGGLVTNLERF